MSKKHVLNIHYDENDTFTFIHVILPMNFYCRFGKRFIMGNSSPTSVPIMVSDTEEKPYQSQRPGKAPFSSVIGDRWIVINRDRPLTKLTEVIML